MLSRLWIRSLVRRADLWYIYIVNILNEIRFAWDEDKNKLNKIKHHVSFEEAKNVFYDEYALQFYDPEHSHSEERFMLLGISDRLRVLFVCHCYLEKDSIIRIISARRATAKEKAYYEGQIK